jgi:hypothetical protein
MVRPPLEPDAPTARQSRAVDEMVDAAGPRSGGESPRLCRGTVGSNPVTWIPHRLHHQKKAPGKAEGFLMVEAAAP